MEQTFLTKFNLETASICVPNYIAVEGAIGVGKTTLTEKLASSLNYDVILEEPDENP
ncbi:MAG: deoxynucleoside kinase, partial [Pseudomonadota bacterium]|nr:deoxynucleoside kinase [Pseudomonadota bacterium]